MRLRFQGSGHFSLALLAVSNIASSALTFLALAILAGVLAPDRFLELSVSYAAAGITTGIMDARFAVTRGMGYRENRRQKTITVAWRALVLVIAGIILEITANTINVNDRTILPTLAAGLGGSLLSALLADLQAVQRFKAWSVVSLTVNAARAITMLAVSGVGPHAVMFGYAWPALGAWLVGVLIIRPNQIETPVGSSVPAHRAAYVSSSLINAVSARLDVPIAAAVASTTAASAWAQTSLLLTGQLLLVSSVMTYALPQAAARLPTLAPKLSLFTAVFVCMSSVPVIAFLALVPPYREALPQYLTALPALLLNAYIVPASLPLYRSRGGWPLVSINLLEFSAGSIALLATAPFTGLAPALGRTANWLTGFAVTKLYLRREVNAADLLPR